MTSTIMLFFVTCDEGSVANSRNQTWLYYRYSLMWPNLEKPVLAFCALSQWAVNSRQTWKNFSNNCQYAPSRTWIHITVLKKDNLFFFLEGKKENIACHKWKLGLHCACFHWEHRLTEQTDEKTSCNTAQNFVLYWQLRKLATRLQSPLCRPRCRFSIDDTIGWNECHQYFTIKPSWTWPSVWMVGTR